MKTELELLQSPKNKITIEITKKWHYNYTAEYWSFWPVTAFTNNWHENVCTELLDGMIDWNRT